MFEMYFGYCMLVIVCLYVLMFDSSGERFQTFFVLIVVANVSKRSLF